MLPLLLLLLLVGAAPVASALFNSFFHDYYGERSFAGFDNFKLFFTDRAFSYSLGITLLWAFANTGLSLAAGFVFALLLNRWRRLSFPFYLALLIPWGIPVYIAVPLWRALLYGDGGRSLLTRLFGIRLNLMTDPVAGFLCALFVSLWLTIPLTTFVISGALARVPRSSVEAARIDGASDGHIAMAIYLPAVRGSLLVMGVLNFISSFKEFTVIFLMTAGGPPLTTGFTGRSIVGATTTLEIFLFELFQTTNDFGVPSAFSVIMFGVVFLVMGIWLFSRSPDRGNPAFSARVTVFAAVSQIVLGWPFGLIWAAGYAAAVRKRSLFRWIVLLQALVMIVRLALQGYPGGLDPGLAVGIFCLFLLRTPGDSAGFRTAGIYRFIWKPGSAAGAVLMAVSSITVIYLLLWISLSKLGSTYVDALVPPFRTFGNFRKVVVEEGILRYFGNTLIVAAMTAVFIPVVTCPAAACLARRGRKLKASFLTGIQIIGITGGMHSIIPLYAIFRSLGMLNSYVPLIMVYLAHSVPFSLFTMTAYLEGLPASLGENARLEGMSQTRYMLGILLPLSLPVIVTAMMVAFLNAWNGFLIPLIFLTDDRMYTISVKLFSFVGSIASGSPRWNLFAAASVINVVFLSLIFLRFRRPLLQTALVHYED